MVKLYRPEQKYSFYDEDYYFGEAGKRDYILNEDLIAKRSDEHVRMVRKYFSGSILEIGSGVENIGSLEGSILLDSSPFVKDILSEDKKKKFVQASAYALPFADNAFDGIVMIDVIEHLANPLGALSEAYRVLKPESRLYVSTFNRIGIGAVIHGWGYMMEADKSHLWEPDFKILGEIMHQAGFSDITLRSYSNACSLSGLLSHSFFESVRNIIKGPIYLPFGLGSNIEVIGKKR